jgi:hypothetical protein
LRDTWPEVADWRELALVPRGAKVHDKLKQGTKELPPLKIDDHVMLKTNWATSPNVGINEAWWSRPTPSPGNTR